MLTSPELLWASSTPLRAEKMLGIMRYVDPLPMPVAAKMNRNVPRNSQKLASGNVSTTARAPTAIAVKAKTVIFAPPNRSASLPPKGRESDPMRAPRKASVMPAAPIWKLENSGNCVAMTFGEHAGEPDERAEGADVQHRHDPGVRVAHAAAEAAKSAFAFDRLFMNLYAPKIASRMNGIQNQPASARFWSLRPRR